MKLGLQGQLVDEQAGHGLARQVFFRNAFQLEEDAAGA